jgi:hypothetical protein
MDLAETPILSSATGAHCSWLHLNSASSKNQHKPKTTLLLTKNKDKRK